MPSRAVRKEVASSSRCLPGTMEEEAQSVRGRGWVKFDGEEETDSAKGNSESPGSLEVRAVAMCVCTQGVTLSRHCCRHCRVPQWVRESAQLKIFSLRNMETL